MRSVAKFTTLNACLSHYILHGALCKEACMNKDKIYVNRRKFMAWVDGVILAFSRGKGIAVSMYDEQECEAAERAMDAGRTIYFTEGEGSTRRVISKMKVVDDGYQEILLAPEAKERQADKE
jgi:hypothetical protein